MFSWIFIVLISYFVNYIFLGDFWQSYVSIGFARMNYMNQISIASYLIITLAVVSFMTLTITWLKNDARTKGYISLIALFYGLVFAFPFLILNLFFNIDPLFPLVKIIKYPIVFIMASFIFIYISGFKIRKKRK